MTCVAGPCLLLQLLPSRLSGLHAPAPLTLTHPSPSCTPPLPRSYTTMISQCGTQQQLRRALELVAEMRSRGVQCNVHTYSALMNVCIKGAPPRLPSAAPAAACCRLFRRRLRRCCRPAVCRRRGWRGTARPHLNWPPPHLTRPRFTTTLTHHPVCPPCAANEMELALDVYRQMLAEGCAPNLVTYSEWAGSAAAATRRRRCRRRRPLACSLATPA